MDDAYSVLGMGWGTPQEDSMGGASFQTGLLLSSVSVCVHVCVCMYISVVGIG